jgi:DNA-directed RNA polymerase subunit RPC12/RpoP
MPIVLAAGVALVFVLLVIVVLLAGALRRSRRTTSEPIRNRDVMIEFVCQNCGKALKAKPALAGRPVECTGCKTRQTVPDSKKP